MKIKLLIIMIALVILCSFGSAYSGYSFVSQQTIAPNFNNYYSGHVNEYFPILNERNDCTNREDIILQISPAGCSPAVVRSDLLAEQNVPVFCQINAIQINPLLDIKQIRSLSFSGEYSKEIAAVGFHPARAALRTRDELLGDPVINNIGYAVIMLKKQANESNLPDSVDANLRARITYESGNALGIGRSEFLMEELTDDEWETEKSRHSFFGGKYFVRLDSVDERTAQVSIYSGDNKLTSTRVELGKESSDIYLPGSYCRAALNIHFDGFKSDAEKRATLEVTNGNKVDKIEVYKGSRFLNNYCSVDDILIDNSTSATGSIKIRCGGIISTLLLRPILDSNGVELIDESRGAEADKAFNDAIAEYELVVKEYPTEKDVTAQRTYGEQALEDAVLLSKDFNKRATQLRLMQLYLSKYPQGAKTSEYNEEIISLYKVDSTKSGQALKINNKYSSVRLLSLRESTDKSRGEFTYDRTNVNIFLKGNLTFDYVDPRTNSNTKKYIVVDYLDSNKVRFSTNCASETNNPTKTTLEIGESTMVCGRPFVFRNVNLEKLALIKIIPKVQDTETYTNLTIKVGIEKRAIQLSPDKINEKVKILNETIEKWDSISKGLNKVNTGLKSACIATSAVLVAKNFMTGMGGSATALARQQIMPHWKQKCTEEIAAGGDVKTLDGCYIKHADEIETMVEEREKVIGDVNSQISAVQQPSTGGVLGDKSIDTKQARIDLANKIKTEFGQDRTIVRSGGNEVKIGTLLNDNAVENGDVSITEMRDLYANLKSEKESSGEINSYYDAKLGENADRIYGNILLREEYNNAEISKQSGVPRATLLSLGGGGTPAYVDTANTERVKSQLRNAGGLNSDGDIGAVDNANAFSYIIIDQPIGKPGEANYLPAGRYLTALEKTDDPTRFRTVGAYEVTSRSADGSIQSVKPITQEQTNNFGTIVSRESITYQQPILRPEIKYYENEPYKGMPSQVPIDVNNGWYAATKQTLPVLGGIGAYDASGRVSSFWLCNAGKNGIMDFNNGMNDDTCRQFNLNTGSSLDEFPGLSKEQTRTYVNKAIQALDEAARAYSSGVKHVSIFGNTMNVGAPSAAVAETSCSDFMSPNECKLMFNLCDPVICPSSRCNLGGKYAVNDVIQSGIVGSALLCLPNWNEGVYIPVCLTGIQAGIDGYISILKSYRSCLDENLKSGKMVGICDQMYSIYTCEFFWRQLAPVVKAILPNLLANAYGQGTRGGGEYLTVMSAWQNAQKSIDYFTQVYAVNSFKAFQARDIEQAGGEYCKSFVSITAPKSIKSLVKPDSPVQFHGYFSSIKYSDVTVPAISQYKVYFHIYAGKDSGASYRVYLRDPPATSYYDSNPYIQVASGYIGKGETKDETKDFTAPEGYKELCVNINGNEECGFKQVSSSFAVNYIKDEIVADQIQQTNIQSEAECISGSPNTLALLNPNLGAGADEVASPDIYRRGIVRVCSTANPGASTDPSRYVQVGNCGEEKILCWLDSKSVENAVTDNNKVTGESLDAGLQQLKNQQKDNLANPQEVLDQGDANEKLRELKGSYDSLQTDFENNKFNQANATTLNSKIQNLFDKLLFNHHKASALFIKGKVQALLAKHLKDKNSPQIQGAASSVSSSTTTDTSSPQIFDNVGLIYNNNKYDPSKEIQILQDNKETGVYLEDNSVKLSSFGIDSTLGRVDGRTIKMLSSAKTKINNELFNLLEQATIEPDHTDSTPLKITSKTNSISGSGTATQITQTNNNVVSQGDKKFIQTKSDGNIELTRVYFEQLSPFEFYMTTYATNNYLYVIGTSAGIPSAIRIATVGSDSSKTLTLLDEAHNQLKPNLSLDDARMLGYLDKAIVSLKDGHYYLVI